MLGGFSQGAATSLLVGYSYEKAVKLIFACSGYALMQEHLGSKWNMIHKNMPCYMYHGTDDGVVPFAIGKKTYDYLKQNGASDVHFSEEAGLEHSVSMDELEYLQSTLKKHCN